MKKKSLGKVLSLCHPELVSGSMIYASQLKSRYFSLSNCHPELVSGSTYNKNLMNSSRFFKATAFLILVFQFFLISAPLALAQSPTNLFIPFATKSPSKITSAVPTSIPLTPTQGVVTPSVQSKTVSRLYLPLTSGITLQRTKTAPDAIPDDTYLLSDYLSSTRATSEKGILSTNTQYYYPYGTTVDKELPNTDKKFTSHRQIEETGIYHAGARFYSPTLGVFIQPDSVEGPNRYAYVGGNPVAFNDPTGNVVANASAYNNDSTAGHPTTASPCLQNLLLCMIGHVDSATGLYSLLAMVDPVTKTVLEKSNQYVSKNDVLSMEAMSVALGGGLAIVHGSPITKSGKWLQEMSIGVEAEQKLPAFRKSFFGKEIPIPKPWTAALGRKTRLLNQESETAKRIVQVVKHARKRGLPPFSLEEADYIARLVGEKMPYESGLATSADSINITQICRQGGGVCRHNAPLATQVGEQLGWQAKQMYMGYTDMQESHTVAWFWSKEAGFLVVDPSMVSIRGRQGVAMAEEAYFQLADTAVDITYYSKRTKNIENR